MKSENYYFINSIGELKNVKNEKKLLELIKDKVSVVYSINEKKEKIILAFKEDLIFDFKWEYYFEGDDDAKVNEIEEDQESKNGLTYLINEDFLKSYMNDFFNWRAKYKLSFYRSNNLLSFVEKIDKIKNEILKEEIENKEIDWLKTALKDMESVLEYFEE